MTDLTTSVKFSAAERSNDGFKHLLLAATGSVATIKIPNIISGLSQEPRLKIRLILTPSASHFLSGQSEEQPTPSHLLNKFPSLEAVYTDESEWQTSWTRGEPILHIELRKWADMMVVAPLSANSLAKWTCGMSEGLVLSVMRAWDTNGDVDGQGIRRIVVCPAMNTAMWKQPVTRRCLETIQDWTIERGGWVEILTPVEKGLACGDVGIGAMVDWKEIVDLAKKHLRLE